MCLRSGRKYIKDMRRRAKRIMDGMENEARRKRYLQKACPAHPPCDSGPVLSKRYGINDMPCIHTAINWPDPELCPPDFPDVTLMDRDTVIEVEPEREEPWNFPKTDDERGVNALPHIPLSELPSDCRNLKLAKFIMQLFRDLVRIARPGCKVAKPNTLSFEFCGFLISRHYTDPADLDARADFTVECYKRFGRH
jgi:hypothetical protein